MFKKLDLMDFFSFRRNMYKLYLFLTKGINYFEIKREYQFLHKNQFKSIDFNRNIQKQRLFNIINFAVKNVPYYKRIAEGRDIQISKSTILRDIEKFPVLTKDIIRENWNDLHVNLKGLKYIYNTSGGTTGEPIKVIHDSNFILKMRGATIFMDEFAEYFRGDKLLLLWGSERDIIRDSIGLINKFLNIIKNHHFQNAFKMSDTIIYNYIKQINKIKPKVILSYIQSIYELAKFLERKGFKIHPVKSIITSAGDLTPELKGFLESILHCNVYNRYGTREVGNIAMSCHKSDKLHINMYQQYIEIIGEDLSPLNEHEKGEIIITNLINYAMPLIRYKIGDAGSICYSECSCGRGFIRFDNVFGRIIDFFKNKNGELVYGDYFTHLFYFRENVKMFQVIQENISRIDINLVTNNNKPLKKEKEKEIISQIKIPMGEDCEIKFNYVNYINPSRSGKFIYTISKV